MDNEGKKIIALIGIEDKLFCCWTHMGLILSVLSTDYGDINNTHYINNVAIAMAYSMLHQENPVEASSHLLKGYHEVKNTHNHVPQSYWIVNKRCSHSLKKK